jgi:hypothetical protein
VGDALTTTSPSSSAEDLSHATCWHLLMRADVGRLGVCVGDHPDVFPVNYVVDGETVVFRTAEGTKLAAAVLGRAVAFEIDGYDEVGTMAELFAMEDLPLFPWHTSAKPRYVRIRPDEVTGRRFAVSG